MTTTETQKRTITLTDRPPVRITEAEWPIIAESTGHSGQHECQANEVWAVRVREHADGRRIVYGTRGRGPGGMSMGYEGWRGGTMTDAAGTVAAINALAEHVDAYCARACIADLPAEEL